MKTNNNPEGLEKANKILEKKIRKHTIELQKSNEKLEKTNEMLNARNTLLKLATEATSKKYYLDETVKLISKWTQCNCVGIRILNEKGGIPYDSYIGFSLHFWQSENLLSVKKHQCTCIRVIQGKPDPQDKKLATKAGSFFCNNTTKYFNGLTDKERKRLRGVCINCGFSSLAVIPVSNNKDILGAIHIADKKSNNVPVQTIEFVESLSPLIGASIKKFDAEENLEKSKRALTVLSEGNHVLVRAKNEKYLLDQICKIIVKLGGYLSARVGFKELGREKNIRFAAKAGLEKIPFEKINLATNKNEKNPSSSKIAMVTKKPHIRKYIQTDIENPVWREQAIKIGFESSIALPLKNGNNVFGVLSIYAKEPNAFNEEEVKLLEELANDLSYGINNLRIQKSKEQSEKRLVESYKHAGLLNRKISILLDLEKKAKHKNRKELAKYVLTAAVNISKANFGILYRLKENNIFSLVSSVGLNKNTNQTINHLETKKFSFLNPLIKKQIRIEINSNRYDLGFLNTNGKIKCFLVLPISRKKIHKLKGAIFLGFANENILNGQELEFYDVFMRYASSALFKTKVL